MCEPSHEKDDPLDVPCVLFNMITPELRAELNRLKLAFERPGMSDFDVVCEAVLRIQQTTLAQSLDPAKDIRIAMKDLRTELRLSEAIDDYNTVCTATNIIRMHRIGLTE